MADPDPECTYIAQVLGIDDVLDVLDPELLLDTGCRVIKHPDCCVLCAANNDCRRLPMHFRCRCRPEGYLTAMP
jgi:hypothetical protein